MVICLTRYFFSAIMRASERSVTGEPWPFMDGSIPNNKNDRNSREKPKREKEIFGRRKHPHGNDPIGHCCCLRHTM